MSDAAAEILLHPIRLRIVLAFGSEELTTTELAERLPDIAQATLYRHVATLADAAMLKVVAERRVRGGIERTYALASDAARIGPDDAATMGRGELLRGFVVYAGTLIEAVSRYLDDPGADLGADPLSFRQAAIWLDDAERAELVERLRSAVGPYLENEPTRDRQRLLLNTILIPDRSAAPADKG